MDGQDALWSALEVKTQAAQARGQVDIFEALEDAGDDAPCCYAYVTSAGNFHAPDCLGWES